MNGNNTVVLPRFYVTKSGFGFEEGIYTQEEIKSLPKEAHQYIISLAVAESHGYVTLDHQRGMSLDELTAFAPVNLSTGKSRKLVRGVKDATENKFLSQENKNASANKLGNALRNKLQDIKQVSAEESLKAKIEAKKKELNK